ncbi:MAG: O-antigen ligase family protein [Eubacteriales bacterium]
MDKILKASIVGGWYLHICNYFAKQWKESKVITAFLTPQPWEDKIGRSSVAFSLWQWIRKGFTALYGSLKLEKILGTSQLANPALWCFVVVVSVGFLPTMLLLATIFAGLTALMVDFIRKKEKEPVFAPMNRYIIFYAILYLVTTFFSTTPAQSLMVGGVTAFFVLFAVGVQNSITTQKTFDRLIQAFVLAATVVALYGIYQYLFRTGYQSSAWVDSEMFSSISFRVASTMDNPNMLGQFFILAIPLAGACLLSATNWEERIVWFLCCAILCICMILTFSRGAWLGLLFAGAVFFILLSPKLIALIPPALIALYFVLPQTVIERFTSIGDLGDDSTSYRVYIWMGTLAMLADYWLSGVGAGEAAFNLVYPVYSYNAIEAPHSHNLFLQILCDGGVVLLLVFCLMLIHYFRGHFIAISKGGTFQTRLFQCATCSGIVGFMVQAMTDYSFYNYRVMLAFWVVVGLGGLAIRRDTLPQGETP